MDFHSVGKTPDTIELLEMAQRELATRNQMTLDLQSLNNKEKTVELPVVLSSNLCSVSLS